MTHVSSHVLLQQKPVAPGELWLSSWQVYEQQEAEVVQGSQQGEQDHSTGGIAGLSFVAEEPVHTNLAVSTVFHYPWLSLIRP